MDEWQFERAAQIEQDERERARANLARNLAPQSHPLFDGRHCIEADCGEEIPAGRLALGKIRCTECQSAME